MAAKKKATPVQDKVEDIAKKATEAVVKTAAAKR